jgi:hypothetical protein
MLCELNDCVKNLRDWTIHPLGIGTSENVGRDLWIKPDPASPKTITLAIRLKATLKSMGIPVDESENGYKGGISPGKLQIIVGLAPGPKSIRPMK